ncbi:MAG TPA: hypothetical protein VMV92_07700 [Streptosporangiaceae bacterium]|nr:hypothetical protein [Streptosporangiaceae bacterium]
MQLGGRLEAEAEAGHIRAADIWPGPGGDRAEHDHGAENEKQEPGQQAHLPARGGEGRPGAMPRPPVQCDRASQYQHGHDKVDGDQGGCQLGQHGQPAEHSLGHVTGEESRRQPQHVTPGPGASTAPMTATIAHRFTNSTREWYVS